MNLDARIAALAGKSVVIATNLEQVKQLQKKFPDTLPQNEPLLVDDFLVSFEGVAQRTLLWHKADEVVSDKIVPFKVDGWPRHIFFIVNDFIILQPNGKFDDIRDPSNTKWGTLPYSI